VSTWGPDGARGGWQQPRRRNLLGSTRTRVIVVVVVALVILLLRTHRLSELEVIYFLVLIPSIIFHEVSHGVVALAFGDDTAKRNGRLTLNPAKHVDPVGTLLVPAILSLSGLGAYGWAKPVPVNPSRLRSPRNHTVVVSLAGPFTNIALAVLCGYAYAATTPAIVRQIVHVYGGFPSSTSLVSEIFFMAGLANLVLAVFNLIPCPPLDGAAVLERMLPARVLPDYYRIQPLLMFLPFVLILLFEPEWQHLMSSVIGWWSGVFA
jgi:Zn-dependent protease